MTSEQAERLVKALEKISANLSQLPFMLGAIVGALIGVVIAIASHS